MKPIVLNRTVVMRRTLAGTLDYLLRQSEAVPFEENIRPVEEDVELIQFIFAHWTTLIRALRAYEKDRRRKTA